MWGAQCLLEVRRRFWGGSGRPSMLMLVRSAAALSTIYTPFRNAPKVGPATVLRIGQLRRREGRPCEEGDELRNHARHGWALSCNKCAARGSAPHANPDDLHASASFAPSVARSFRNAVHAACNRCHCGTPRAGDDAYGRFTSCVHGRNKSHRGAIGDFAASRRVAGRQDERQAAGLRGARGRCM